MTEEPDRTGGARRGQSPDDATPGSDLDRRRRALEEALASHQRKDAAAADQGDKSRGMAGFGYAMRLSSEFIAAIIVGAGLGWIIDWAFGITPWGLVVFLLLGFCAGVLNVLRAAGLLAEFRLNRPKG